MLQMSVSSESFFICVFGTLMQSSMYLLSVSDDGNYTYELGKM